MGRILNKFPTECPSCTAGLEHVDYDSFESDSGVVWQEATCWRCRTRWHEVYQPHYAEIVIDPERLANGQIRTFFF